MDRLLLLDIILYGILFTNTGAWSVKMPSNIHGLHKSCLVIPCSFSYSSNPPYNPNRVVWYQYVRSGYPLVYDSWYPASVIDRYKGRTKLYTENKRSHGDCSLLITDVSHSHNGDRIYIWIDPENVGKSTFRFFDVSTYIQVDSSAERPRVDIYGGGRIGESITVKCKTYHTCPYDPPSLSLSGIKNRTKDRLEHKSFDNVVWEITLIREGIVQSERQEVTCSVRHSGGLSASTTKPHIASAACIYNITIDPKVADVVEGVGNNFTCTVFRSCKDQPPTFTWNYKDIPETVGIKRGPPLTWGTYSNILFIASLEDDGKKLTCTATFPGGEITTSIVVQVKKYVPKVVDPFENDTLHIFEAQVEPRITALIQSCVVIPCTFQTGGKLITRLRGLWYTNNGEYVYHTGMSHVMDNFKGRTKLLGNPDEQNCTLEIDNVQAHDNGPFCFHAEKGNDKYRFNHSCVFIMMKASPDKPVISAPPEEMEPGKRFTIQCSVTHTCSSHTPKITWNVPAAREEVSHVVKGAGKWETTSTITFIPTGYEEEENLVCQASFWKGKKQESSTLLSVKRIERLGMDVIGLYIILPLVSLLLLFCTAAGIIIYRKRVHKNGPMSSSDLTQYSTVQYCTKENNVCAVETSAGYSKPRLPSPKRSGPVTSTDPTLQYCKKHADDDDDYTNTAELM